MELLAPLLKVLQILMIDIAMTADNAIAVGLVVAGLDPKDRARATALGLLIATILRIIFSLFAVQLLKVAGLMVAGGLLLLWVCWKLFLEVRASKAIEKMAENQRPKAPPKTFFQAIFQIALADLSMSLDNVLAVAGVSKENPYLLVLGLVLSVSLMGFAANYTAKLVTKYPILIYLGLASVFYSAMSMIIEGWHTLPFTH